MKNIRFFYLKFFSFLEMKFSIYLNRHVLVMKGNISKTHIDIIDIASFAFFGRKFNFRANA